MNTQSLSPGAKVVPANKLGPPWGPHRHVHCGHCPWPGCWEVLGTLPLHPLSYPEQTHLQSRGPPGKAQGARLLQQHTGVAPRPVTQSPTADWTPRSLRGTGSTHGWPWPNFTGRASGSVGSESWAGGGPSLGRKAHNRKHKTTLRLDQDEKTNPHKFSELRGLRPFLQKALHQKCLHTRASSPPRATPLSHPPRQGVPEHRPSLAAGEGESFLAGLSLQPRTPALASVIPAASLFECLFHPQETQGHSKGQRQGPKLHMWHRRQPETYTERKQMRENGLSGHVSHTCHLSPGPTALPGASPSPALCSDSEDSKP
nr:uncharacterized protein LOC112579195 [Bubalus bubalis]